MKKKLAVVLTAAMVSIGLLSGCGQQAGNQSDSISTPDVVDSGSTTPDVLEDESTIPDEVTAGKDVILVVSFGTSYNDNRDATIGAIEEAITAEFQDYEVRRAFTSQIIIDKLKERDGLEIDNVEQALEKLAAEGVRNLVVQPTHLMDGYEYMDLKEELSEYEDQFGQVVLGAPLLIEDSDFEATAKAIAEATASKDDGKTAICFMGHGTEAASNSVYAKLQTVMADMGYQNYFIGTVEAAPTVEDLMAALDQAGIYEKVVLQPLMVVAGDHANNDMAGEEEDSWKSQFEAAGYEVECILEGLGQNEAIRQIYVSHTQQAIDSLSK